MIKLGLSQSSTIDLLKPLRFIHDFPGSSPLLEWGELQNISRALPPEFVEGTVNGLHVNQCPDILSLEGLHSNKVWVMLRNVEQIPSIRVLIENILSDLNQFEFENAGGVCSPMCYVFISSPYTMVPLHIDPEHNFLFQVSGSKTLYIDNGGSDLLGGKVLKSFFEDEVGYRLHLPQQVISRFERFEISSGAGVYIPVVAPHLVENGGSISVSFSFTFRSKISQDIRRNALKGPL